MEATSTAHSCSYSSTPICLPFFHFVIYQVIVLYLYLLFSGDDYSYSYEVHDYKFLHE